MGRGLDTKHRFRHHRRLPALPARDESRDAETSIRARGVHFLAMNPLANEWPIKHRADACAVTQRPFVSGEQFYTLLFREGDGFRREDLSEEAWASRERKHSPVFILENALRTAAGHTARTDRKRKRGRSFAPIALGEKR